MGSSTVRYGGLVAILGGYVAILGYGAVTGTVTTAIVDLYAGVLLLGIGTVRYVRDRTVGTGRPETVAFVVAGVAIGYNGVSALWAVPSVAYINTVGDLTLIAGLLLLLHRTTASRQSTVAE